jgi:hypothetical protein
VQGDLLPAQVEDADQPGLLAQRDLLADVFGRDRVVGPLVFDVAIPMNLAGGLHEVGEQIDGQGLQGRGFHGAKMFPHLSTGGNGVQELTYFKL